MNISNKTDFPALHYYEIYQQWTICKYAAYGNRRLWKTLGYSLQWRQQHETEANSNSSREEERWLPICWKVSVLNGRVYSFLTLETSTTISVFLILNIASLKTTWAERETHWVHSTSVNFSERSFLLFFCLFICFVIPFPFKVEIITLQTRRTLSMLEYTRRKHGWLKLGMFDSDFFRRHSRSLATLVKV